MIHGIIYGILIAFTAYFTVLSIRQKSAAAMWFTFYIICLGLFMSSCREHLQDLLPVFTDFNDAVHITVIGLLYFTCAKFLRTFLNINFYSKPTEKAIHILQWMGIVFIPINLMPNPFIPIFNMTMVSTGLIFSCGISVFIWIKGVVDAGYFTIGWIMGLIAIGIDISRVSGIISEAAGSLYLLPATTISSIIFFGIAIIKQSNEYREYADKDILTGIANLRFFNQALKTEWNRNLRNQNPLSVMLADIDGFKAFKTACDKSQSDECLKTVARIFNEILRRAGDLSARYENDAFIAVLPDTLASEASFLADKIREAIEAMAIKHEQSRTGKIVTISIGTGTMVPNAEKIPADIIMLADKALSQAKDKGGNRVVCLDQVYDE